MRAAPVGVAVCSRCEFEWRNLWGKIERGGEWKTLSRAMCWELLGGFLISPCNLYFSKYTGISLSPVEVGIEAEPRKIACVLCACVVLVVVFVWCASVAGGIWGLIPTAGLPAWPESKIRKIPSFLVASVWFYLCCFISYHSTLGCWTITPSGLYSFMPNDALIVGFCHTGHLHYYWTKKLVLVYTNVGLLFSDTISLSLNIFASSAARLLGKGPY